ncbi:hypothetical protein BD779DRAFT_1535973 [Infundibulicybe gibba]|nr:hypothetical protein BD779DRAFT_1564427 [Infundibulicybe gibba]KAF8884847.1 hypothetical protein BD779DRAFT_1535973 [Infundibulicybe gibba]
MHAKCRRKTRILRKSQQIEKTNQILLGNKNIQYRMNLINPEKPNRKWLKAVIRILMTIPRAILSVGQKSDQKRLQRMLTMVGTTSQHPEPSRSRGRMRPTSPAPAEASTIKWLSYHALIGTF